MKILASSAKVFCKKISSAFSKIATALAVILLSTACNLAYAASEPAQLTDQEKLYGLNLIRKETMYNYAFFDRVPTLEYEKAYKKSVAEVLASKSTLAYYQQLQAFVALLKNSNTYVEMPKGLADYPPLKIEDSLQQAVITAISEELAKKIPLGSIVLGINGQALDKNLREQTFPRIAASSPYSMWEKGIEQALTGKPGSKITVVYLTQSGRISSASMKRDAISNPPKWVTASGVIEKNQNYQASTLEGGIGYINLGNQQVGQTLSQIKKSRSLIRKSKALIIDLRFNQSNSNQLAAGILPYLTRTKLTGPSWKTRIRSTDVDANGHPIGLSWSGSQGADLYPNRSGIKKTVPMIFLISRDMGRGAENLLGYVHQMRNALLLGEMSGDTTTRQVEFPLPGGGRLTVATQRGNYSDKIDYAGYGIQPDYMVKRDPAFFVSDQDKMLQRAIIEVKRRM
ncbi:S41 family peptidase [Pelagibaculum spongiae]|nr:S41 family peptidase [Pelagibaculum spongiae]